MSCRSGTIKNPETGRCVKRNGSVGRSILAAKKSSPKKKSPARKPPAPRTITLFVGYYLEEEDTDELRVPTEDEMDTFIAQEITQVLNKWTETYKIVKIGVRDEQFVVKFSYVEKKALQGHTEEDLLNPDEEGLYFVADTDFGWRAQLRKGKKSPSRSPSKVESSLSKVESMETPMVEKSEKEKQYEHALMHPEFYTAEQLQSMNGLYETEEHMRNAINSSRSVHEDLKNKYYHPEFYTADQLKASKHLLYEDEVMMRNAINSSRSEYEALNDKFLHPENYSEEQLANTPGLPEFAIMRGVQFQDLINSSRGHKAFMNDLHQKFLNPDYYSHQDLETTTGLADYYQKHGKDLAKLVSEKKALHLQTMAPKSSSPSESEYGALSFAGGAKHKKMKH